MRALAAFCYRRRRFVALGWIGLLLGLSMLSAVAGGKFKTEFKLPGSESQAAIDLLKAEGVSDRTGFAGQVVFKADQGVDNAEVRRTLEGFFSRIESEVEGVTVASPYESGNEYMISSDKKTAYAEVNFSDRSNEQYFDDAAEIKDMHEELAAAAPSGLQIELGGDLFIDVQEFSSEMFGILAAVVILLIVFGSLLAMGLPILSALFGIGTGAALIGLGANVLNMPDFTSAIAAMIGIGVGIDYALLIVTRYRTGLHEGLSPREATILAVDTSGRAVVFAGMTVVISLLGMFFLNLDFMRAMATGAVLSVLMTMLASITLLPALLGFVGYNIDRWSVNSIPGWFRRQFAAKGAGGALVYLVTLQWLVPILKALAQFVVRLPMRLLAIVLALPRFFIGLVREAPAPAEHTIYRPEPEIRTNSFWYKWSRVIQSNPWPALALSAGFLILLAIPAFSIRLGFADAGNRLETDTTRRAYDILSEGFGVGFNSPILVLAQSSASEASRIQSALESTDGVASAADPIPVANGRLHLINVFPESAPQDEETTELVHRIRTQSLPPAIEGTSAQTFTTGGPGFVVDFSDYMLDKLPIFFGAVLILSFLLLMTVFHSVVVPVKAVLMNMLSIGASFGAMVAVFQWGIGAEIIGLGREGPIEAWAPMMIFAIVFGLSMDYEVFLLTRVREEYDRTGNNSLAVADGLAATGRVISAAALIMICVFGAFILGHDRSFKLMGFGLAFAVLIDATIVRLVLVPSAMELLGKANWWAPSWLVRYLPHIKVDTVDQPIPQPGVGGGS